MTPPPPPGHIPGGAPVGRRADKNSCRSTQQSSILRARVDSRSAILPGQQGDGGEHDSPPADEDWRLLTEHGRR
jgi:hypothetical protein